MCAVWCPRAQGRHLQSTERFYRGVWYLWRIRPHVQTHPTARMHATVITTGPRAMYWGTGGVGVPRPSGWLPQQGGLVMHGCSGEQDWAGGCVGGGEQHWAGGGVEDGEWHDRSEVQGGGEVQGSGEVQGQPEQVGGEAYVGGPLSSTIGGQATEGNIQEPTLFAAHLTSLGKWHASFARGCHVKPTRPGSKIFIGDCCFNLLRW